MIKTGDKLTEMQLELLKSFRHITDEKQLREVKSLLNFYFQKKLDEAIDQSEKDHNYIPSTYEDWLNRSSKKD